MGARGWLQIGLLALVTLPLMPVQWLAVRFRWPLAAHLPQWWHRFALARLGVRVIETGTPVGDRPVLLVANHTSWLDICVFGSLMPVSFIAKSEVGGWPVFGTLARLQRSVFIDRTRRTETGRSNAEIARRMASGDAMLLFAEGTTSDGNRVLPFRSALIGAARAALVEGGHDRVMVQPVAIAYTRHHGIPLGRHHRPLVAWPGGVELLPHLKEIVRRGAMDVEIVWCPPIAFDASTDRKVLTAEAESAIRAAVSARLSGRS